MLHNPIQVDWSHCSINIISKVYLGRFKPLVLQRNQLRMFFTIQFFYKSTFKQSRIRFLVKFTYSYGHWTHNLWPQGDHANPRPQAPFPPIISGDLMAESCSVTYLRSGQLQMANLLSMQGRVGVKPCHELDKGIKHDPHLGHELPPAIGDNLGLYPNNLRC